MACLNPYDELKEYTEFMKTMRLDTGCWGTLFAVPTSVVDHFIKLATPEALKVLLYLLRHSGRTVSSEELCSALRLDAYAVEDAMCFWEQCNFFTDGGSQKELPETLQPSPEPEQPAVSLPAAQRTSAGYLPTPTELATRASASEEVQALLQLSEQTLGHPLNYTEQRSLLWMHDYLGFSPDVLLMLLAYCISVEHPQIRYVESIAVAWQTEGIVTVEAAEREIRRLTEQHSDTVRMMRLLHMQRWPTKKQMDYFQAWKQRGEPDELLVLAYERTIEAIDKLNLKYMDKMLLDWLEKGLRTAANVEAFLSKTDAEPETRAEASAHSYDLDAYKANVNRFEIPK